MAAPLANSNPSNTGSSSADQVDPSSSTSTKAGSISTPPPRTHQSSHQSMASQQEIWKLEQYVVGALVRVDPDPPIDPSILHGHNHHGFHRVRDDHLDVFSFSSAPELYGGVDVSFRTNPTNSNDKNNNEDDNVEQDEGDAVAVYVVVDRRTMQVVYHDHIFFALEVPYVPGFLAFREIEPLEILVQRQIENHPAMTPKAILVDGNGILHPRQAGIACFLGTRTDIPTIGIGKSLLYEGGWTRESVDVALDHFIQEVHTTVGHRDNRDLAILLSRFRGLIVKNTTLERLRSSHNDNPAMGDDGDVTMQQGTDSDAASHRPQPPFDRKKVLFDLAPFCNGLAIPLTSDDDSKPQAMDAGNHSSSVRFPVLGCALIGHGGQIAATNHSTPLVGSSKPIFVSVGHKLSLQEAVRVSASLSLARIPEPIRKADLYGRELMRQREANATTNRHALPS